MEKSILDQFLFWCSIVSTLIALVLAGFEIWQLSASRHEENKKKSQVKIWQQDANGIAEGLRRIAEDADKGKYSSAQDVANSVRAIQASSESLRQSLYEERVKKEEEYKKEQDEIARELRKAMPVDKFIQQGK